MDQTSRFALPLLAPGQAQKELFHNEALLRIDALLCAAVEGNPLQSPPANPVEGACYIVAAGATGGWAGQDEAIACFTDGGWRFVQPVEGVRVLDRTSGKTIVRRGNNWEPGILRASEVQVDGNVVLRGRQSAIAISAYAITP